MDELPENIVKTVVTKISYKCVTCRSYLHIGEYEEHNRANQLLDEWLNRHKPGHRVSY